MRSQNNPFPPLIELPRFGQLKLSEIALSHGDVFRIYKTVEGIPIAGLPIALDPSGLSLVVSVSQDGIEDVDSLVSAVERSTESIVRNLLNTLMAAVPAIDEAISDFWQIPGEPAPNAWDIVSAGELKSFYLFKENETHLVQIFDRGDLIGSHDLIVTLDSDFEPVDAHFDG